LMVVYAVCIAARAQRKKYAMFLVLKNRTLVLNYRIILSPQLEDN
jgi:hypothetical protein